MAKKLPMLEEFEQNRLHENDCKCGGNCTCGDTKIDEAKKYKFKDLAKAWEFVYGEDMEDEYQGFYQEVTGKYRNKVTKKDIAEIWDKVYGEDIAADYDGFFSSLKENLNEANKIEEFNNLNEANPDGTISDDEDERRAILEEEVMMKLEELIDYMKEEANSIGGKFRAPGIEADCIKAMKSVFKSKKVRI